MMIDVKELHYRYDTTLFHFQLQLAAGEMGVVLGPSGAGKSTLLNLIAGFIQPTHGEIWLNNRRCDTLSAAQRPISILFQDNNLFPHLTIFQNIALGINPSLRLTALEQESIHSLAKEMELTPLLMRYPEALSGGQRQRAALARCVLRQQPILLLDEPFAALDPRSRHEMMRLLKRVCEERGTLLLMVSHQIDEALHWIPRAIVVDKGTIVFDDKVDKLRDNESVKTLLGVE